MLNLETSWRVLGPRDDMDVFGATRILHRPALPWDLVRDKVLSRLEFLLRSRGASRLCKLEIRPHKAALPPGFPKGAPGRGIRGDRIEVFCRSPLHVDPGSDLTGVRPLARSSQEGPFVHWFILTYTEVSCICLAD